MKKTKKINKAHVASTIVTMNWNHGRGEVTSTDFLLNRDDAGIVTRTVPVSQNGGFTETRKFRIVGNSVHFLGHQLKIMPFAKRHG